MNENYYLLLNLSIERFISGQEAAEALDKQLKLWRASNNTTERDKAEKYEKPIKEALSNTAEWERQYQNAKKIVDQAITNFIMTVRGKGHITTGEITTRANAFKINSKIPKYRISEAYLTNMIKAKGIEIKPTDETSPVPPPPDLKPKGEIKFKQPARSVEQLGCEDYYQVLQKYQVNTEIIFTAETDAAICVSAAKAIENAWKAKHENAEKSALQSVCTTIIGHFSNDGDVQNQEEYNKYLIYIRVKGILDEIKGNFKGSDIKIVDDETKGMYISKIVELVANRSQAEVILENFCKENDITLPRPIPINARCPFCNSSFSKKNGEIPDICPVCHKSFMIPCPKCGKNVNFAETRVCCGFNLDQYGRMEMKCKEARSYITVLNFQFAESRIQEIEKIWPNFPELATLKKDFLDKKKEAGRLIDSLRKCVAENRFQAARQEYLMLTKSVPGYSDEIIQKRIEEALSEATKCYQNSKIAKSDNEKLQHLIRATEIVTDYTDALRDLGAIKPESIDTLQCNPIQNAGYITLKWKSKNPDGTAMYVVLRKEYNPPVSTEDGKIAQTRELAYSDNALKRGIPYFYAVYAVRGNNKTGLKQFSEPIVIFPEISSFNIVPTENSVQVNWTVDVGECQVEVFQCNSENIKEYGKGKSITKVTSNSFEADGLSVNQKYYYNVFLTLKVGSKKLTSPPFSLSVSPVKVSKPLDFTLQQAEEKIFITLKNVPEKDEKILFYTCKTPIVIPENGILAVNKLTDELKLSPLKVTKKSDDNYEFIPSKNSKGYIYIVSVRGETAVIGHEDYYENLEMLSVKSALSDGVFLHIQLEKWPETADIITVAYQHEHYPISPDEAEGNKFTVNKLGYKAEGIVIKLQPDKCYYISGFIRGGNGYTTIFHTKYGTEKKIKLSYYFSPPNLLGARKLVIVLPEEGVLPEMVLCCKEQILPGSITDSKVLLTISTTEKKKEFSLVLPKLSIRRNIPLYGKLFLKDKEKGKNYVLMIAKGHTALIK